MTQQPFPTSIESADDAISGPWRSPRQMLAAQEYDAHASIHDDATAQKLGFKGGTIEGPTHFSQFAPLGVALFGPHFLAKGCISAHYRAAAYEGEEVQAFAARPGEGELQTGIWMMKRDGTEVLRGTLSIGEDAGESALSARLKTLPPLEQPVLLADVKVGMKTAPQRVRMDPDQNMGALYPFTLTQKLERITEPSPWYTTGEGSPFGRAIVPFEMISVLLQYSSKDAPLPSRGPAVGLFADQEIKLIDGPLFVGEDYEVTREVVALSGSRRTESMWVRTEVRKPGDDRVVAAMLLNHAILKDSYAPYAAEFAALYP
jgi:hypothetical protein